ncbi:hypothetical protein FPFC_012280 [Fructobacillus pseudoficulneus]|uniref:Lysozyme n=1 Tax=Fructobacillus pseudoficulneus TaxID=220714 RepID=A0A3F3H136_9LACO|nr:GH25 family lysozyme [Fructobacillus pseudoficulneus]GAP02348.1 hypothetical protein FPFC_012280 [Fructobacillus pseudoficulneus]SEH36433.1 Glycosyl hydrolases family 25 [Fructobacillus pseudoficulneus]
MNLKNTLMTLAAVSVFGVAAEQQSIIAHAEPYITAGQSNTPKTDVVDVSSYQGNLSVQDFQAMRSKGVMGVVVKLTEGTSYTNPYDATQVNNARAAGMRVSAYHYAHFTSQSEARDEANYFADRAAKLGFTSSDLLVDDLESSDSKVSGITDNAKAFNDQLHARGFANTGLYTGPWYINSSGLDVSFIGKNRTWIADYPDNPTSQLHTDYGMWQWSSKVSFPGVSGNFDVSSDYVSMANAKTGYLLDTDGQWYWFENGQRYTGFRYYMGTYYWFENGVRFDNAWHEAWGHWYYTDANGRAVQGVQNIDGQSLDFGNDGGFYLRSTGYIFDRSSQNGGYRWYENGQLFTGFRYYMGTYYWFIDGVRQNAGWRSAWGYTYYTDDNGRAVQGIQTIDGKVYNFGNDGTYYERNLTGYIYDGSSQNGGYRWYENGQLFTGFRYYMGTYYWFVNGVRQNAGWRQAWGYTYYTDDNGRAVQGTQVIDGKTYNFGNDGTYYLR